MEPLIIGIVHRQNQIEPIEIVIPNRPGPMIQVITAPGSSLSHSRIGQISGMSRIGPRRIANDIPTPLLREHLTHDPLGSRRTADIPEADEQHFSLHPLSIDFLPKGKYKRSSEKIKPGRQGPFHLSDREILPIFAVASPLRGWYAICSPTLQNETEHDMTKNKKAEQKTQQEELNKKKPTESNGTCTAEAEKPCDNMAEESDNLSETPDTTAKEDEAAEWKDKYLRLSAEFDNYRKRTLKEKMDLITAGGEEVIKSLLVVVDDIDRALAAMETTNEMEPVKEGVKLISQKLNDTLRSKGLSEIEALGKELDTDLHEAVAKIPASSEEMKGKIMDVVQKGYKLRDKVIRYAKVVVGE